MKLEDLPLGERAQVERVEAGTFGDGFTTRLRAMGIESGKRLKVLRRGTFGGPLVVQVGTTTIVAMRRAEAALVVVRPGEA